MTELFIPGIISCVIAFVVVYFCTPPLISYLQNKNITVRDVNKSGVVMVARPGGPVILCGIISSGMILYIFLQSSEILAILLVCVLAFAVGFVDDRRIMGRWFKPVALGVAATPILLLGVYDANITFPLFGVIHTPIVYVGVVIFMILVTGNTVNSIDVLNGAASGFMVISGISLSVSLIILQNYEIALVGLSLVCVSLAFYKYHKIPSRIFPGDSGALVLGGMYGAIAIVGNVEVVAAVAILPAVLNSFFFLSSVKRIVEHRQIQARPVLHTKDMKIAAATDAAAPFTLVRLITSSHPMSEHQVVMSIFKLAILSGVLAVITAIMMTGAIIDVMTSTVTSTVADVMNGMMTMVTGMMGIV